MSTATIDSKKGMARDVIATPVVWKFAVLYSVIAALAAAMMLSITAGATTRFQLSTPNDAFQIPLFEVPARPVGLALAAVLIAMAALALWSTANRRTLGAWFPVTFGLLFILGFLLFAGAGTGRMIALTTLIAGALALSVPLIFGAMCGLVGERSGIVNIAIEGQLLMGAFAAAIGATVTGNPFVGLITAAIGGGLVGALLVFFAVKYWVDQIIIGVVLNVLVVGLTGFFYSTVLTENASVLNHPDRLPVWSIPGLSAIPVIGPVLFSQTILVYLMYVIVAGLTVFVFRSRWGLRMRAVGEHPKAADTVGINVNRTRVINTIFAGMIAGLGGAFFTVGTGLAFGKEMTAGLGYIALAAMILGNWNPLGALAAALLFGFSRNLANMLSVIGTPVPSEILLMLPYVVTIFAVAGFVGKVRPPASENIPYIKQ
ncbi:MAG: ABC transporter permease [Ruaniaceae bacterium]|nr:ABC transporter permease [Ruaniaceae bacterium]